MSCQKCPTPQFYKMFDIQVNPQNQYFVSHPFMQCKDVKMYAPNNGKASVLQNAELTRATCFDVKYGMLSNRN